ncbi:hypothetical protein EV126DRAFT_75906 [Verticillium dahliae]|nr:hypothetical protein EV126DRAFT_75906 [Verticillium dahliae]
MGQRYQRHTSSLSLGIPHCLELVPSHLLSSPPPISYQPNLALVFSPSSPKSPPPSLQFSSIILRFNARRHRHPFRPLNAETTLSLYYTNTGHRPGTCTRICDLLFLPHFVLTTLIPPSLISVHSPLPTHPPTYLPTHEYATRTSNSTSTSSTALPALHRTVPQRSAPVPPPQSYRSFQRVHQTNGNAAPVHRCLKKGTWQPY